MATGAPCSTRCYICLYVPEISQSAALTIGHSIRNFRNDHELLPWPSGAPGGGYGGPPKPAHFDLDIDTKKSYDDLISGCGHALVAQEALLDNSTSAPRSKLHAAPVGIMYKLLGRAMDQAGGGEEGHLR